MLSGHSQLQGLNAISEMAFYLRLRALRGAAINNLPVPEQLSHPISLTQGGE